MMAMAWQYRLLALFAAFLLLFGCIAGQAKAAESPSPEKADANGTIGAPTVAHELTGSPMGDPLGGMYAKDPKITCSISFRDRLIYAGESLDVSFSVYSGEGSVDFSYECGSESGKISSGGLVKLDKLCLFPQPGAQAIRIFADGEVCTEKPVEVLPSQPQNGSCSIDASSVTRDLQAYYYEMKVDFEGFAPTDELRWVCDYTTATRMLGGDGAAGMPRSETISCNYPEKPRKDHIEVYVGETLCGTISTR